MNIDKLVHQRYENMPGGGEPTYKKYRGAQHAFYGLKKCGFATSWNVYPQKVNNTVSVHVLL